MGDETKKSEMGERPNCYECKWRGEVPGSAHSKCRNPIAEVSKNPMAKLMSIFAGVGRGGPMLDLDAAMELGVKANFHGIQNGWFNWPYDFDPTWLVECKGFIAKEKESGQ